MDYTYFDGKTSKAHKVTAAFTAEGVTIRGADGQVIAFWPSKGLTKNTIKPGHDQWSHKVGEEARLVGMGPTVNAGGQARTKAKQSHVFMPHGQRLFWASIAALGGLLLVVGIVLVLTFAHWSPASWRHTLGDSLIAGLTSSFQACDAPIAQGYVGDFANRLARGYGEDEPVHVHILQMDMVNAFAFPGGHVVLTSGLIKAAEHPEELAGVIAHEVGHVVERHPTSHFAESIGIAVIFLMTGDPTGGFLEGGLDLLMLSNSRVAESEADHVAQEMLHNQGHSALGLKQFFEDLPDDGAVEFFSTHPDPKVRAANIKDPSGFQPKAPFSDAQWQVIKAACDPAI